MANYRGVKGRAYDIMSPYDNDAFDWVEAERLADLRDFKVLAQMRKLRKEMTDVLA